MAKYKRLKDGTFQRIDDAKPTWDQNADGTFSRRTNKTTASTDITQTKTKTATSGNSVFDNYKHYMDADDFAKQSQYKSTKSDAWHRGLTTQYGLGFEDITYEYINNVDGTREKINDKARTFGKDTGDNVSSQEKKGYDRLSEEEIAVYNYIYSTEGKKKAQEFLDSMETTLTKRVYDENTKAWKDATDNGTVASAILSAASVPANIIGTGQSAMESVADILQGKEYNPYGYYKTLSNFSADTRQYVGENIEESTEGMEVFGQNIPSFLYQTGMSVGDSVAGAAMLGGGYSVLAGMSSANQRARELKEAGASSEEITRGAIATGVFEMIFEKFSLDNLIKVKDANTLAQMTKEIFKQAGVEASEEMATETANVIFDSLSRGKKSDVYTMYQEYLDSGLSENEAKQKVALELGSQVAWAGAGGALSGAALGSAATLSGKKSANKLTENEQKVLDKEVENRIAEKEADGTKLKAKEKAEIREQVQKDLEKGYISIDTIESTLGGETYNKYKAITDQETKLQKEIESLENMPNSKITVKQNERLQKARTELQELQQNSNKTQLKEQLSKEVQELTLNDKLSESYNEKSRRSQAFETDISKYDAKQQATIQKAIDSKILNNTNRAHEFVDMIAKISADKGVSFDFTNNENLKNSGFALEGKSVNGYVKDGNITLNIESSKALNSVVGHEITHVLEGSELYTELQQAVKEYATTKGEYDSRFKALTELYKDVEGANIENELTADLIGDYLFSDEKFVQQLSAQNRNIFQKIYDEIKYLCKVVSTGSKEAKQLEKVKKLFEQVYKENGKITEGSKKFSLGEVVDKNNNSYGIGVHLDSALLDNLSADERIELVKEYVKELGGQIFGAYDTNGNAIDITIATSKRFQNSNGKKVPANKDLQTKYIKNETKQEAIALVDELVLTAKYDGSKKPNYSHDWLDNNGKNDWEYWTTYIQDKNNTIWEATLNITNSSNGEKILYDINPIKKVGQSVESDTSPTSHSISQNQKKTTGNQKIDYSLGLSNNDIAPIGNWNVHGEDIALEDIAPVREEVAPAQQSTTETKAAVDDIAPWTDTTVPKGKYVEVEAITPVQDPRIKRVKSVQNDEGLKQRKFVESATESDVVNREILPKDLDQSKIMYQPISNKVTLDKVNTRIDANGYEKSVSDFESKIRDNKVTVEDIVLGERLIQEAMKRGDTETAGELIQNVAILGTELGQKVQALSIINRLTPAGQLKMLQKTVARGKTRGDKAFDGVEITQEMIDHILNTYGQNGTYDQKELNKAVEEVKQQIADQMQVTKMEKVNAWRYLSMLGNPKTHIRNIVSNVAMKGTLAVKNATARTIESIAPINDRTKTWRRASDTVKRFAKQTTVEMKDDITGEGKYSNDATLKAKRDIFKHGVFQKVYDINSDLLEKEDWWFSKSAFQSSFQEFLTANGIKTEEDIQNNTKIIEKGKRYALEQSQIATFRQYSWLASKISDIENKNVATQVVVGSVLPFKKTPINVAKAGLNYSPLGFAKTLTYDINQLRKGDMEASTIVDHLAQNITGTGLAVAGYLLASSGFLNGGGEDDKEGTYDYYLGEQAYSLNIDGNTYSLSWLSPVAMPLFVGANAYEQLVEGKEWNADVVMETLAQTLDPLSEMSFLSSLDDVLSSYDSGVEKFMGMGKSAMQNYITQFIPTLSSQIAATLDDTKRSTKVSADSGTKMIDEVVNQLKYKIPVLRETLEPSTDIWGKEVKQSDNLATRAVNNFLAPWSEKEGIATDVDTELKNLYVETGDNGLLPSIPYNYVNFGGEKYKMSAGEHTQFKQTYGQTAKELMEELFATTTYRNASSEDKADMVNRVYDYAGDVAKKEYLAKEGVEYTNATKDGVKYYKEDSIKGAVENDMSIEEFDCYLKNPEKYTVAKAAGGYTAYDKYTKALNGIKADKDENGNAISGNRKRKVVNYINGLDASYGEKLILFKNEYPSDDTYNYEIIEYLNSRSDISYSDMETILKELGFTVEADGTVRW